MDDALKLAILEKMGEQLQEVIDSMEAVRPLGMSIVTYEKIKRDANAQLETLKWAHTCCELTMVGGMN